MDINIGERLYQTDRRNVVLGSHSDGREYFIFITGIGKLVITYDEFLDIKKEIAKNEADDLKIYDQIMSNIEYVLKGNSMDIEAMIDRKLGAIRVMLENIPEKMHEIKNEINSAADSICSTMPDN